MSLLRAEWQKAVGNRWVTGFLIWIFPVGALGLMIILNLIALFSPNFRQNVVGSDSINWTQDMLTVWGFLGNPLGRMFLIALTAVIFAGEYQWGTWKNILPRNQRFKIILAKFLVLSALILAGMVSTSLIWTGGRIVLAQIANHTVQPEFSGEIFGQFLGDYAYQGGLAFTSVLITAVMVAVAAMISRSILGAVIVGIAFSLVEPILLGLFFLLANIFNAPSIFNAFRVLPLYNLSNIDSWVQFDRATNMLDGPLGFFNLVAPVDSLAFSILIISIWIIMGVALVILTFQRQDITS